MMGDRADESSVGTSSQSKKRKIDEKITIINDPVWGPIELDPLCMKIINTPQFQRLRHIKQLGGCSFVYPEACHSRFEHSIGTAHLARMMGEELQKKHTDKTITDQDILCLEVAGLCHDLGHGPFSHLFDQQFKKKLQERAKNGGTAFKGWTHEDLSIEILGNVFETINRSVEEKKFIGEKEIELIKALIKPSKSEHKDKPFLYEIISNEENNIDVDKWDYFSRDCHMLGLHHNFQCQRSIKLARIVDNHISFPKSEYFNLFDMFYTRFTLHRRAYQHPVVKAVEMMIADAFIKADIYLTFPPRKKTREEPGGQSLSKSIECMDAYQWVTDDVLQQIRRIELDDTYSGDVEAFQNIIDRIYCRDLYKLIGEKRVKWVKESLKNIAEKLTTLVNSLEQSETKTARLKNRIGETAMDRKTLLDDLEHSETETARLNNAIDDILNTDQVPEAKSLIQNGTLKDYVAKELTSTQVLETLFEIEVVVFDYGSGRDNPMNKVKFHEKIADTSQQSTNTDQYESVNSEDMDEKKSDMLPTTFEQMYVRLYWKGDKNETQHQEWKKTLQNAFFAIKEFKCSEGSKFKGELVDI